MTKVLIAVLVFTLFSCTGRNDVPADIIKPALMQQVFWDIIRGDILAQEIIKKDSTQNLKNTGAAITEKIFAIHKIDRAKFEKSLAFYEKHPALIKTILDSLGALQTRNNLQGYKNKIKPAKDYKLPNSKTIP